MKKMVLAAALLALSALPAAAQEPSPKAQAGAGKKPSEILSIVEARSDFARLEEMTWNDDGYYDIVYRTADKARVEINLDATSGNPVDMD
jgi:opacity protein-like surface antigen